MHALKTGQTPPKGSREKDRQLTPTWQQIPTHNPEHVAVWHREGDAADDNVTLLVDGTVIAPRDYMLDVGLCLAILQAWERRRGS